MVYILERALKTECLDGDTCSATDESCELIKQRQQGYSPWKVQGRIKYFRAVPGVL